MDRKKYLIEKHYGIEDAIKHNTKALKKAKEENNIREVEFLMYEIEKLEKEKKRISKEILEIDKKDAGVI